MTTWKASSVKPTALYDASQDRVRVVEVTFTEADGSAAGVYTGSVIIPSGSYLVDIIIHGEAVWDAGTDAIMIVGDTADPNGFIAALSLKTADLTAAQSINFYAAGGQEGADIEDVATAGSQISRRYLAAARTITGEVTTTGNVGTAGVTRMIVVYARPTTVEVASFVAT